ncbi:MAG: hypothetical protein M1828_005035 [Chrysothrix sp. TS-e1954]|nr:MAG: hypothetical protein M1828_005035 [Chrysothrix sp. TS-e1954]
MGPFAARCHRMLSRSLLQPTFSTTGRLRLLTPPNAFSPTCRNSSSKSPTNLSDIRSRRGQRYAGIACVAIASLTFGYLSTRPVYAEASIQPDNDVTIRKIRLEEISKHDQSADTYWVIRGDRVYDVTDWVPNHPGGEVILRGAGGAIDRYWDIFTIHKKQDVYDILEQYFIGVVDPQDLVDGQVPAENIQDPFETDPDRDPRLKILSDRPCNAETPTSELSEFITPNDVFYIRNHLWVPEIESAEKHTLTIELFDGTEKTYSLSDLREKFRQTTVTVLLQCSGNRRYHMTQASPTKGLQWEVGAIGNANWTGVRLRDVLADAGFDVNEPDEDIQHAQFTGTEAYGASIPIDKAIDRRGDVLLAYEMNGKPIPRDHGYPLRAIVPGHVAARSVKWVNKVTLSDEESTAQWQRRDYKCFGPNEKEDSVDWESAQAIQETPVQSAITKVSYNSHNGHHGIATNDNHKNNEDGKGGEIGLKGYAYAGGGRRIIRVDVSADDGLTWDQAELLTPMLEKTTHTTHSEPRSSEMQKGHKAWAWQRWSCSVPRDKVKGAFRVKAVDEGYNQQPETQVGSWNFKGNLATAWQRLEADEALEKADEAAKADGR